MKWFKHFSDANSDDKLVSIRARFGLWGIGAYWTLVESVCAQMTPKNPKAEATFLLSELAGSFGCKRGKVKSFLELLHNNRATTHYLQGDLVKIEIPRLLKSLDNYHKNLQVSGKPSTSTSTSVSTSKSLPVLSSISVNRKKSGAELLDLIKQDFELEQVQNNEQVF